MVAARFRKVQRLKSDLGQTDENERRDEEVSVIGAIENFRVGDPESIDAMSGTHVGDRAVLVERGEPSHIAALGVGRVEQTTSPFFPEHVVEASEPRSPTGEKVDGNSAGPSTSRRP